MKIHVLVSDHLHEAGWEILHQDSDISLDGPYQDRRDVLKQIKRADGIIVRSQTLVDEALLDAAPRLAVIGRAGSRLDNVDIDAATQRGILVINVPDASINAMAEHTFALLLALARGIPAGYTAVQNGNWPRHSIQGFELAGKQFGIIGFGALGRAVAARAQAFGMHILAYDPNIDLALARETGIETVNFDELLERADIISLHIASTPQTRGMLSADVFPKIKPGSYLINSTHADLVDEKALLKSLDEDRLAGAALDTLLQEPPGKRHPLIHHPRVIVTPHLNQNTIEAQTHTSCQIVTDVIAALKAEDYRNVVNLPFSVTIPYQSTKPYLNLAYKMGKMQGQLAEGWITRLEVEVLGENSDQMVRCVAAAMLSGMIRPVNGRRINWVSAPVRAYEQGISTCQVKGLVSPLDYTNLIACRVHWRNQENNKVESGNRTLAGVLFGNGEARLVFFDEFHVDAYPEGYVLILENEDVPGVIGKVGTRLGRAGVNIAQWRYGREVLHGRAVSFINLDSRPSQDIIQDIEKEA
jgi:D-3-phosphoglycerate dehydrogenase